MNNPKQGTLLLTSFGLNTINGAKLISKELCGEDLSTKSIFLVSLTSYGIDEILHSVCLRMGFLNENIFFSDTTLETQLNAHCPKGVDYIYVTEGNTFKILRHLRQKNLIPYIRHCVAQGSTYIGASAGAMLAGKDVKLALEFDQDLYNTTDFTSLRLFDGVVIPHYTASELARFIKYFNNDELIEYKSIYNVANDGLLRLD